MLILNTLLATMSLLASVAFACNSNSVSTFAIAIDQDLIQHLKTVSGKLVFTALAWLALVLTLWNVTTRLAVAAAEFDPKSNRRCDVMNRC